MTILDADGKAIPAMLPTIDEWTATLRGAYRLEGIEPELRSTPDGGAVIATYNEVSTTHDLSFDDPTEHVRVAANAMRNGPIWKNGWRG